MDNAEVVLLSLFAIGACVLLIQRWFWVWTFGLCSLAALFSCIASIVHFHIGAAIGFIVLSAILGSISAAIKEAG